MVREAGSRYGCRLRLGYAPSECGHPSPHPDGASLLGRRRGTHSLRRLTFWTAEIRLEGFGRIWR